MKRLSNHSTQFSGESYDKDYVDMGSFVKYFENEKFEDVKSRILGEFPQLLV